MTKTVTIPIPFKTLAPQINEAITPEVLKTDVFQLGNIGTLTFGPLNNEKSVNTTAFANGIPTIVLNKDASFTYVLPVKISGDHMKLHVPSGWKEEGKILCATAQLQIRVTLTPMRLNVSLNDFAIDAHAEATVPSFAVHVDAPLAGIADKLMGTKLSASLINTLIAPKFREIDEHADQLIKPAEDLKPIPIVGSIARKFIVKGCSFTVSDDNDTFQVHLELGM
jgi:hypothetical protein